MFAPLAVKLNVWPAQIEFVPVLIDNEGTPELTVTVTMRVATQFEAEVADKEYTVVALGVITIEEAVLPLLQE